VRVKLKVRYPAPWGGEVHWIYNGFIVFIENRKMRKVLGFSYPISLYEIPNPAFK